MERTPLILIQRPSCGTGDLLQIMMGQSNMGPSTVLPQLFCKNQLQDHIKLARLTEDRATGPSWAPT